MSRSLPPFLDRLQTVCDLAQAGSHFEEQGCWGMTLALYDVLQQEGHHPQIHVQTDGVIRAYVVAEGQSVDHRGAMPADVFTEGDAYTPAQLIHLASEAFDMPREDVLRDRAWSHQLIEAAQAWVPRPVLAPIAQTAPARRRRHP